MFVKHGPSIVAAPKISTRLRRSYMRHLRSSRHPTAGEQNFPLCKALKSHKTRKSLPQHPQPPSRYPERPNRLDEVAGALLDRSALGVDKTLGLGVERLAARQDRGELGHRLRIARHRALVALLEYPLHVQLGRRLQPDRVEMAQQERERLGL